ARQRGPREMAAVQRYKSGAAAVVIVRVVPATGRCEDGEPSTSRLWFVAIGMLDVATIGFVIALVLLPQAAVEIVVPLWMIGLIPPPRRIAEPERLLMVLECMV